jgi:alpha-glucosidase
MDQRSDNEISTKTHSRPSWWQRAVIYQIAPLSFQDSNGDGKGDLNGVLQRIDYLAWLRVDAVWLCPFYPSPMLDFGYDIADFCAVGPQFGSLADFDRLLEALHGRGIRVLLDFVPNHTSDQHPWFKDSRSSPHSPKRDWYLWADPAPNGGPPNNWLSRFGGSAWEWDAASGQYYYHAFLPQQPDLNWRNPQLRAAMADVLRFWLRRGVDGFRVDASAVLAEDELLRDDPPNPSYNNSVPPPERFSRVFSDNRPESLAYIAEMRAVVDEFPDRVLAGEVQGAIDRIGRFYGTDRRPAFHLPLNYVLLDTPWSAINLQAKIDAYLNAIPHDAWPDWIIGGHDKKRIADRIPAGQERIAAMLAFTLPGTAFFFAGDELGMHGVKIPADRITDEFEKRVPGYGLNRDPERAPMRWESGPKAGFTTGEPWLPIGVDVAERNVAHLQQDTHSILWLYRRLLELRHKHHALTAGAYQPLRSINQILRFARVLDENELLIALNISSQPRRLETGSKNQIVLSTHLDRDGCCKPSIMLRPNEGLILGSSA